MQYRVTDSKYSMINKCVNHAAKKILAELQRKQSLLLAYLREREDFMPRTAHIDFIKYIAFN